MIPLESNLYNSDELLENAIIELLQNSHVINSEVTVTANNGDITLEGTVETQEEKDAASSVVTLVQGVSAIHNDIVVTRWIN